MKTEFHHFGENVCGIVYMPITYSGLDQKYAGYITYDSTPVQLQEFSNAVENCKYKYIFAITTIFQAKSAEILKKQGFRKVVVFKSSHNDADQLLTLWTKIQKDAPDLSKERMSIPCGNCTVSYGRTKNAWFRLTVKKEDENEEDLRKNEFKRVKNTPIWFYIGDGSRIEEKVAST